MLSILKPKTISPVRSDDSVQGLGTCSVPQRTWCLCCKNCQIFDTKDSSYLYFTFASVQVRVIYIANKLLQACVKYNCISIGIVNVQKRCEIKCMCLVFIVFHIFIDYFLY